MAIVRSAGTEIIRSAHFEYIAANTTPQTLIFGVQHHIYTVLSIVVNSWGTEGLKCFLLGYDALEGTTAQYMHYFNTGAMSTGTSYVWNDKFSFNGHEPVNFTGPMDSIVKQDAIADQGSSVHQDLQMQKVASADDFHVHITYIDQNNA